MSQKSLFDYFSTKPAKKPRTENNPLSDDCNLEQDENGKNDKNKKSWDLNILHSVTRNIGLQTF